MIRTFYPGGVFGDALPTGEFCVLIPGSHIETHLGRVELPAGEKFGPLYLRCTNIPIFKFAGQAHDTENPAGHEWNALTGWHPIAPPCHGQSPLIYDAGGTLRRELIVYPDGSVSSQGYRYVAHDGRLVTGDATYAAWHGLSEWSAITDDLYIGQGHDIDGALIWDWTALRVLEPGNCTFIRCAVDGENVAIALRKPEGVVIFHGTLAELRALPLAPIPGTMFNATPAPTSVIPPLLTPPKPMSKKKKFGSWLALIGGAVTATLILTHQGPRPAPRPTPVPPVVEQPAPTPEPPPAPVVVTLPPLTVDGPIFRANGEAWRWKGVSAFGLLNRYAHGEDISDFLTAYQGYNLLRVWPYVTWTPEKNNGAQGWESPAPETVIAFLRLVEQSGFYVELTLLTDADLARHAPARDLIAALVAAKPQNLVLEIGNEPETHKAIDTAALIPALDASGFLYATGNYENSAKMRGSFGVTHTARSADWPRRAHDLYEFFHGGGPNEPSDPAHRFAIVADEPAKPGDIPGGMTEPDVLAYFGGASLMGGGATWHCETCKFGKLPSQTEATLAAVALRAMNAFPADAPLGSYRRIVEAGQRPEGRTYVIGGYMVRSQQDGRNAPEPGWTPIDESWILWKR